MRMMVRFTRQTGEKALDLPEIGTLLKWVIYVRLRGELVLMYFVSFDR